MKVLIGVEVCFRDWADVVLSKLANEPKVFDDESLRDFLDPAFMARQIQQVAPTSLGSLHPFTSAVCLQISCYVMHLLMRSTTLVVAHMPIEPSLISWLIVGVQHRPALGASRKCLLWIPAKST